LAVSSGYAQAKPAEGVAEETGMRVVEVVIASCILTLGSAGAPSAQFVNPLSVLEESRRDRIELDKRIAREAAAQRLREIAACHPSDFLVRWTFL